MKSILVVIIIAICTFLGASQEARAKANCIVIGPETSLKELEEALSADSRFSEYLFVTEVQRTLEIYYDTPNLLLLNDNRFIRFQSREKLGQVKQISINHEEFTFRKKSKYSRDAQIMAKDGTLMVASLRQYRNASSQVGKHPLLGMIKRDDQEAALTFLKENGLPFPLALKGMMHVSNTDLYIGVYGKDDKKLRGVINLIASYDTESGDHIMTSCLFDDDITSINTMMKELEKQFGAQSGVNAQGEVITTYGLLYRQMAKADRFFDYRMRYPSVFNLGQASILFLCGLGLIGIMFGKRFFKQGGF